MAALLLDSKSWISNLLLSVGELNLHTVPCCVHSEETLSFMLFLFEHYHLSSTSVPDNMAVKKLRFFNKVRNPQPCEFGSSFCSVAVQRCVLILGYTRFDLCEFAEMNS